MSREFFGPDAQVACLLARALASALKGAGGSVRCDGTTVAGRDRSSGLPWYVQI